MTERKNVCRNMGKRDPRYYLWQFFFPQIRRRRFEKISLLPQIWKRFLKRRASRGCLKKKIKRARFCRFDICKLVRNLLNSFTRASWCLIWGQKKKCKVFHEGKKIFFFSFFVQSLEKKNYKIMRKTLEFIVGFYQLWKFAYFCFNNFEKIVNKEKKHNEANLNNGNSVTIDQMCFEITTKFEIINPFQLRMTEIKINKNTCVAVVNGILCNTRKVQFRRTDFSR